eukprot:XP_011617514.1 PREDICTED: transmembrane protein 200C-like [Takifugu rubripes]
MIATGGLLRITARRQDSLPKTRKAHKSKKSKQKRTEVVVVKGKLKLISVSGLVASLGFLVLLVGMVMAALGYWPRDGPFFKTPAHEGAAADSAGSTAETAGPQKREAASQPEEGGGRSHGGVNGTGQQHHSGFLKDLLYRYLHSDRLKVWGPLIMGVGIFLFICGNAVLHENRDKKTKVINLRDIYSTVIDLQRGHKPSSPSAGPLNGLVNYVQSKSLESKSRFSSLHLEAPGGSRALLLSSPFAPPGSSPTPDRRCSLPIITCCHHNSCEMQSSHHMTSHL